MQGSSHIHKEGSTQSHALYHYYRMAGPWNKSAATSTWELWLL